MLAGRHGRRPHGPARFAVGCRRCCVRSMASPAASRSRCRCRPARRGFPPAVPYGTARQFRRAALRPTLRRRHGGNGRLSRTRVARRSPASHPGHEPAPRVPAANPGGWTTACVVPAFRSLQNSPRHSPPLYGSGGSFGSAQAFIVRHASGSARAAPKRSRRAGRTRSRPAKWESRRSILQSVPETSPTP